MGAAHTRTRRRCVVTTWGCVWGGKGVDAVEDWVEYILGALDGTKGGDARVGVCSEARLEEKMNQMWRR